jgi:hypothetical protein
MKAYRQAATALAGSQESHRTSLLSEPKQMAQQVQFLLFGNDGFPQKLASKEPVRPRAFGQMSNLESGFEAWVNQFPRLFEMSRRF